MGARIPHRALPDDAGAPAMAAVLAVLAAGAVALGADPALAASDSTFASPLATVIARQSG